jgi:hypothetical protein
LRARRSRLDSLDESLHGALSPAIELASHALSELACALDSPTLSLLLPNDSPPDDSLDEPSRSSISKKRNHRLFMHHLRRRAPSTLGRPSASAYDSRSDLDCL